MHKRLTSTYVEDIGAFVALAFAKPQFLGKTIELTGDELREAQIAATFAKVIGRPVKLEPPKMPDSRRPGDSNSICRRQD